MRMQIVTPQMMKSNFPSTRLFLIASCGLLNIKFKERQLSIKIKEGAQRLVQLCHMRRKNADYRADVKSSISFWFDEFCLELSRTFRRMRENNDAPSFVGRRAAAGCF